MSSIPPTLLRATRIVAFPSLEGPGWVRIEGGIVAARGAGPATPEAREGATVVDVDLVMPGLVDIHVHGALGIDFSRPGDDPRPAIDHHRARGSTTLVATLATGEFAATERRLRELSPFVAAGELAGMHLEGPWLSARRRGAHAPTLLRAPDLREIDALLDAAAGTVRMVTLAPELPGAFEAIAALQAQGVVVAIGHSDADAATTAHAIDAGATVVTHLFNGMPPLHHREPGVAGTALAREDVAVELIADGIHVDDLVTDIVFRAASGRVLLVSDAMAATGLGDGAYELAGSRVVVSEGIARLADGSSLAGSTASLGVIVTRLLARGMPADTLAAAASTHPAAALGIRAPALAIGDAADLVAFSHDGTRRTMKEGRWLAS